MKSRSGINRIRLEFKAVQVNIWSKKDQVLIESDWNLKHRSPPEHIPPGKVLIESDWNLKQYKAMYEENNMFTY